MGGMTKKLTFKMAQVREEESKYEKPAEKFYDLEALQTSFPDGVDPAKKEMYLEDAVFVELFKMTKDEFSQLKDWKRKELRKKHGLF